MIRAHKNLLNRQSKKTGFTILELVMVMVVVTTILGSAVMMLSTQKEPLSGISTEVAQTVSEAHRLALANDSAYYLIARSDRLWVTSQIVEEELQATDPAGGVKEYLLPSGIEIAYRRSDNEVWKTLERGDSPVVWCFSSTGLAEPVFLRVSQGEGYAEMEFDPLTGGVVR